MRFAPPTLALALALACRAAAAPVEFSFDPGGAASAVTLAGPFNGWSATATPMSRATGETRFTVTLDLAEGLHPYKFVVDGRDWRFDPAASRFEPDGVGGTNSVRLVGPDFESLARRARRGDGRLCEAALRFDAASPEHSAPADGGRRVQLRALAGDLESAIFRAGGGAVAMERLTDPPFDWFRAVTPSFEAGTIECVDGDARLGFAVAPHPPGAPRRFDPPRRFAGVTAYHLLVDRFDDGDPANDPPWVKPWDAEPDVMTHLGGDLAGVRRRLGHIRALGATALFLSPLFESRSAHGYEPEDYDRVAPRLGGEPAFAALSADLAAAGVALVVDLVLNHTGTGHPAFRDLVARGENSTFKDWYFPASFPVDPAKGNYRGWKGHGNLPELNAENPGVRAMLLSVGENWAKRAGAFRLDAADDVEPDFWREFRTRVKAANPEILIIGEIWGDAAPWLSGDMFDSVTNYPFRRAAIDWLNGAIGDAEFRRRIVEPFRRYPDAVHHLLVNMTGSHDTKRLATELADGTAGVALYAALLFAWPGIPCVYAGDEIGMEGGDDPENRRGFRWSPDPEGNPLRRRFAELAALRAASAALSRGALLDLRAENGILSFERRGPDGRYRLLLHRGAAPAKVSLPPGRYRDLLAGGEYEVSPGSPLALPPRSALLFASAAEAPAGPALCPPAHTSSAE